MRTNDEIIKQTNELARRFGVMSGFYIKTPNPDFRNIDSVECQKFWAMACLAQEMLTGANPHICNSDIRAATEVTGDDADIKREFERIERASAKKTKSDTQTKSPSAVTDGL